MDWNLLMEAMNTLGVPVIGMVAMAWFCYNYIKESNERYDKLSENHKSEVDSLRTTLEQNTLAITKLVDTIEVLTNKLGQ